MPWMFHYSVTFEFMTQPPVTHRGYVKASSTRPGVARAVDDAEKALKPQNWSSCVICILERAPVDAAKVQLKDNA